MSNFESFSPKQIEIFKFPQEDYDTIICEGSIRSGKTSCMSIAFIIWAMDNFDECDFGICGKTVSSAIRNVVRPLMRVKDLKMVYYMRFSIKDNMLTVTQRNYDDTVRRNYFYVFGGKDESSYTLIQGVTLAGVLVDEVALQPQSFVNQAVARCSVEKSRLWFNCNPDYPEHWFKKDWIDQADIHHAKHLHLTLDDNPSLSDEIKERYHRQHSGVFYDRYILGKWVKAEGLIYRQYADDPASYEIPDDEAWIKDIHFATVGIDFGGNRSKTSFVATGFHMGYNKVSVLSDYEIEGEKGEINADILCREFLAFILRFNRDFKGVNIRYVFGDSHDQYLVNSIAKTVKQNGLGIQVRDSKKIAIKSRIILTNTLMNTGRIFIHKNCKRIQEGFKNAVWDSKHEDTRLDDFTSDIDILDAFEYSIEQFSSKLCPNIVEI